MKRGGSLSFLVRTISNVLVMEISWTDVGSGGYILVSCAHSNTTITSIVSKILKLLLYCYRPGIFCKTVLACILITMVVKFVHTSVD